MSKQGILSLQELADVLNNGVALDFREIPDYKSIFVGDTHYLATERLASCFEGLARQTVVDQKQEAYLAAAKLLRHIESLSRLWAGIK